MEAELSDPERAIARTTSIIRAAGVIGLVLNGIQIVFYYSSRGYGLPFWVWYVFRGAIVPGLYLWMSPLIRRHSYGALVACGVVAGSSLLTQLLRLPSLMHYARMAQLTATEMVIVILLQATVLATVMFSRSILVHWPSRAAVHQAMQRAGIALYAGGAGMILLGILPIAAIVAFLLEMNDESYASSFVFGVMGLMLVLTLFCWILAIMLLLAAPRARRMQRPSRLAVAAGAASLAILLFITDVVLSGGYMYFYGYDSFMVWLPLCVKAVYTWQLIELIHARRMCDDPAAFGFEPIFATPVIPLGSNDASSA